MKVGLFSCLILWLSYLLWVLLEAGRGGRCVRSKKQYTELMCVVWLWRRTAILVWEFSVSDTLSSETTAAAGVEELLDSADSSSSASQTHRFSPGARRLFRRVQSVKKPGGPSSSRSDCKVFIATTFFLWVERLHVLNVEKAVAC